jgi:glycosyltransferase involved in cell wall biosynthesis
MTFHAMLEEIVDSNLPTFSIVVPTFNRAHTITRTLNSVLAQTWDNFELIVVNDGSTDNTEQVIKTFTDHRIRYVYQANQGRSKTRNSGAAAAKGIFLTFLDSDDEAEPNWLASLVQVMDEKSIGVICCGMQIIDPQTGKTSEVVLPRLLDSSYGNQHGLFYPPGTFVVRRDVFKAVGGYVETLAQGENTELGRRIAQYCIQQRLKIRSVMQPLIHYYRQRTFDPNNQAQFQNYLDSATYMLNHHGEALQASPRRYALSCGIAGVNALRLGRSAEARRFFRVAIYNDPWHWKHYLRFALALMPGIGKKYWLRVRTLSS